MKKRYLFISITVLILAISGAIVWAQKASVKEDQLISYIVDPKLKDLKLYWRDERQVNFRSILNLKKWLAGKNQQLLFAMNGGMYMQDNTPLGLYIENQKLVRRLNTATGKGNFYIKPNGIFYLTTANVPVICSTAAFTNNGNIKFATQSGPMLVIDGQIHTTFKEGSTNLNIRNGVGILPGGKLLFAMSKKEISFYDFANYFKQMGCKNALYLDGFVSRTYLPEKNWVQTDGDFGVIIGVTKHGSAVAK